MKDKTIIYKSAYLTVASGADQTFELPVGLGAHFYLQFGNITGLTCSLTVSYDGGTQYVNVVSVTSAGTAVAAGGTITTADGLKVYFDSEGATHVKVTYVGGTDGPVRLMGTDGADGLIAARLLQFIASGLTVIQPDAIIGPADPVIDSYTHAAINLTTGADQVLASSAASKQIWVYGFGISVGDADGQTVSFQDEDNTALSGIMEFARYGGMVASPSGNFAMPLWKLATNKDLEVDITGGDADGWIEYAVVSV